MGGPLPGLREVIGSFFLCPGCGLLFSWLVLFLLFRVLFFCLSRAVGFILDACVGCAHMRAFVPCLSGGFCSG